MPYERYFTLERMRKIHDEATDPRTKELFARQIAYEEANPDWDKPNWFDRLCEGK